MRRKRRIVAETGVAATPRAWPRQGVVRVAYFAGAAAGPHGPGVFDLVTRTSEARSARRPTRVHEFLHQPAGRPPDRRHQGGRRRRRRRPGQVAREARQARAVGDPAHRRRARQRRQAGDRWLRRRAAVAARQQVAPDRDRTASPTATSAPSAAIVAALSAARGYTRQLLLPLLDDPEDAARPDRERARRAEVAARRARPADARLQPGADREGGAVPHRRRDRRRRAWCRSSSAASRARTRSRARTSSTSWRASTGRTSRRRCRRSSRTRTSSSARRC